MSIESKIKKNIKLAPFTTFKIGGPAEFFIEIKNIVDLVEAVNWAKENNKPIIILAGGSNILINDQGIKGIVIKLSLRDLQVEKNRVKADSGVSLARLIKVMVNNNLTGLEWAVGIPGTIGGAVRGNAGAFGSSISQFVYQVKIYDVDNNSFKEYTKKECKFKYRDSIFKHKTNFIIIQVILKLNKGRLSQVNNLLNNYQQYRLASQPQQSSAGCIFKNLEINILQKQNIKLAKKLKAQRLVRGGKIGAGWFIEQAGLKGKIIGGAKVSEKHANFIINTGQAKAKDVIKLANLIEQQVKDKFNISLNKEIQLLGF